MFKSEIFFIAVARINIEVDILKRTILAFVALALNSPILEYILLATNNSANNPPIAANELANLLPSIVDIIFIEAANIAIAAAIFNKILAFRFF